MTLMGDSAAVDGDGGCLLSLKVVPRSSRNQVVGIEEGLVKIKLHAPPVEGAANEGLVCYLSKLLKRPKNSLSLVSGHQSRHKRIKIGNMKASEVLEILRQNIKEEKNG